ncbi:Uncharacterised protein [Mycobacterium tuberculosis]|nr:Uncharacterised protein [Mycobacterium tuberculosis]
MWGTSALVRDIYTVESESALVHTALGIDAAQADLWDAWQEIDALALSHADSRAFLTECRAALDEV